MAANYNQGPRNSHNYEIDSSNQRVGGVSNSVSGNNRISDSTDVMPYGENRNVAPQKAQSQPQPQHSDFFTMIPPNESQRSKLTRMAQKELEDYQRWREENRPRAIQLPPMSLGGEVSMAEARGRQYMDLRQAPLKKKMMRNEQDKNRKQEEEDKLTMFRAAQRTKAEQLEERTLREEQKRREENHEPHLRTNEQFLHKMEHIGSAPAATSSVTHTSSWARSSDYREGRKEEENAALEAMKFERRRKSEELEKRRREEEEQRQRGVLQDHRRVNSSFLDRLQGIGSGGDTGGERGGERKVESSSAALGDQKTPEFPGQRLGGQEPLRPPQPDPEDHLLLQAEGAGKPTTNGADADYVWAVMKLQNSFPVCERVFLGEIVEQCDGDYQKAHALLSNTFY